MSQALAPQDTEGWSQMADMRVLVSAPYVLPVVDRFRPYFEARNIELVEAKVQERLSETDLLAYAGQIDGAICGDDGFTAKVLEASHPRLKVVSKWGTGVDSIDREAAERLGIQVCNTPGAFTDAVADTVMAYVLSFARQTPWMDRRMKVGQWEKLPGVALHERTLGVVGVGRIGKAVLQRAQAFGMRLLGNDIVAIDAGFLTKLGVTMQPLEELLRASHYVSLNCDLNETSFHLIDSERLATMRSDAILINASRGHVVHQPDLVTALQTGEIAGAALDVYEDEPLPHDSPLRAMDNVLLAPHNANSSPEAWERVHRNTIDNLLRSLGKTPVDWTESAAG